LCYGLYQYGQRVASGEVDDPSFFMAWWEPRDPSADHRAESTWEEANPGLGDLVGLEDFQSTVRRTPENEYRTKRCNQWVASAEAWLPTGAWDACSVSDEIPDGTDVVLSLDGSFNNDSTALIVATVEAEPLLDVAGLWEKPRESDPSWRVPISDVEDAIRAACRRWNVREVAFDPFRWARTMQALTDEGLPIVEYPQSPARMVPATQRFYEAVLNRTLRQSGNPALARHVGNCMVKVDQRGSRLTKETKNSPRKIDAAVAAVMAVDRAVQQAEELEPSVWVF
jgi:phage terminase large subunit-like protein